MALAITRSYRQSSGITTGVKMQKRMFGMAGAAMAAGTMAAIGVLGLALQPATAEEAPMTALRPDQTSFRAIYKELVETNTTLSSGSCTLAAERMAAHLKAAGFSDKDVTMFSS